MNKVYAKIDSTGIVQNVQIISSTDIMDPTFTWVDITDIYPQPCVGWTYETGTFTAVPFVLTGSIDTTQAYLKTGSASTFADFTLSEGYLVHYDGTYLEIGCQTYDALWLRYVLYQIVNLGVLSVPPIYVNLEGDIGAQGFYISPSSMQQLLTALETINFGLG